MRRSADLLQVRNEAILAAVLCLLLQQLAVTDDLVQRSSKLMPHDADIPVKTLRYPIISHSFYPQFLLIISP